MLLTIVWICLLFISSTWAHIGVDIKADVDDPTGHSKSLDLAFRTKIEGNDRLWLTLWPSDILHADYQFISNDSPKSKGTSEMPIFYNGIISNRQSSNEDALGYASAGGYLRFSTGSSYSINPTSKEEGDEDIPPLQATQETFSIFDIFSPYLNYISRLFSGDSSFSQPQSDARRRPLASIYSFPPSESKIKTIELVVVNDPARTIQLGEDDVEVSTLQLYNIVQSLFDSADFGGFKVKIQILAVLSLTDDAHTASIPHIPKYILSSDPIGPNTLLDGVSSWIGTHVNLPFSFLSFFLFQKRSSLSNFPWLNSFDHLQLLSGRVWDTSINKQDIKAKYVPSSSDSVEGLAFVRGMCQSRFSVSIVRAPGIDLKHGSSRLISLRYQAQVIAHELGHSLSASHDGLENSCPDSGYIMQASAISAGQPLAMGWSPCAVEAISEFLHHPDSRCLDVRNVPTTSLCGNGIVDEGEECDSGSPNGSSCCTSSCKLTSGSECDDRNGRCCQNCLLRKKGDVCRPISTHVEKSSCDVVDICTGQTPACPDLWKPEGSECIAGDSVSESGGIGICESGVCFSREAICKRMGMGYRPECDPGSDCLIRCYDFSLAPPQSPQDSLFGQHEYEIVHSIRQKITDLLTPFFNPQGNANLISSERCITFALSSPTSMAGNGRNAKGPSSLQHYVKTSMFVENSPLVLPNGIPCAKPNLREQGMCYNGSCKSKADYEIEIANEKNNKMSPFVFKNGSARVQRHPWNEIALMMMCLNLALILL